jgi:uncharacterized damage-inducible protein DinB
MTHRDFYIERWEAEFPATIRVFKALPADKLDYRPHPRSRSAGELVALLVGEEKAGVQLCDEWKIDWSEPTGFGKLSDMIAEFERHHRAMGEKLKKLDEAAWDKRVGFFMGGKQLMEESAGAMLWSFLLDAIHHRGQLSVYIRPMGGKVPSIYGPSADDSGM